MTREKADLIMRKGVWLSHVSEAFRNDVLRRALLLKFAPGETVFRYGDPVGGIYGLVTGTLVINTAPPDATPRLIHLGVPGAWTGEGCFMTGQPRRGEMRAFTEIWMMHLPLDTMEQMAARDPNAIRAFGIISILGFDVLIRIIHDLQKREASRRIASVLQRMTWIGDTPIPLSQADLGIMTNTSRQQVNAALQRFVQAGWVQHTYRSITVTNSQALRKYSEEDGC